MKALKKTCLILLLALVLPLFSLSAQNAVMVQDPASFDVEEGSGIIADETVPVALKGIWENSQRYIIFDSGYVDKISRQVVPTEALKLFYGWYLDRAAESDEYTSQYPRERNDAESRTVQQLQIHFEPLIQEVFPEESGQSAFYSENTVLYAGDQISGAWDMQVKYPGIKEIYHIPICVIGDSLYLKFRLRYQIPETQETITVSSQDLTGFWCDVGWASGITISPPYSNKELLSYFNTASDCFHIRYWETDMEYDPETQASFSVEGQNYQVPKHLLCGGRVFTCVNGRSKKIRNIERTDTIPEEYTLNSVKAVTTTYDSMGNPSTSEIYTSTICALGEPYLKLVEGSLTYQDILEEASRLVRPKAPPLFPPHGLLDFDWSIIEDPPSSYDRRMLDLGK